MRHGRDHRELAALGGGHRRERLVGAARLGAATAVRDRDDETESALGGDGGHRLGDGLAGLAGALAVVWRDEGAVALSGDRADRLLGAAIRVFREQHRFDDREAAVGGGERWQRAIGGAWYRSARVLARGDDERSIVL